MLSAGNLVEPSAGMLPRCTDANKRRCERHPARSRSDSSARGKFEADRSRFRASPGAQSPRAFAETTASALEPRRTVGTNVTPTRVLGGFGSAATRGGGRVRRWDEPLVGTASVFPRRCEPARRDARRGYLGSQAELITIGRRSCLRNQRLSSQRGGLSGSSSKCWVRRSSLERTIRDSSRASGAPTQWWMPRPKPT